MRRLPLLLALLVALAPACTRTRPEPAPAVGSVLTQAQATGSPAADDAPQPFPATPTPLATPTPVEVDRSGIATPVPVLATPRGSLPVVVGPAIGSAPSPAAGSPAPTPTPRPSVPAPTPPAATTVVQVAEGQASLSRLVAALTASGLAASLADAGPYTVFAPNDAAFAALPAGVRDALLQPENRGRLIQILKYHVVPGRYDGQRLRDGFLASLEGQGLPIDVAAAGITAGGAKVLTPDLAAGNGVVHIIDKVVMPPDLLPEADDLPALLAKRPGLNTIIRMLDVAELAPLLRTTGPFTLFAPTDGAWEKLPAGAVQALMAPANKGALAQLLKYHVVPQRVAASQLKDGGLATLLGPGLPVVVTGQPAPRIAGATVSLADSFAGNGVLHLVDGVCMPPGFQLPK